MTRNWYNQNKTSNQTNHNRTTALEVQKADLIAPFVVKNFTHNINERECLIHFGKIKT